MLVDLPNWVGIGGHTFALKEMGCTFDRVANHAFTVFLAVLTVALPMVVVFVSYLVILCYIRSSREKYKKYFGSLTKQRKRDERQFTLTLFVAFIGFVSCWSVYMIAMVIDRHDRWPKQIYVFGTLLGHSNSYLNSIIYASLNHTFRRGYSVFLKTICCRKIPKEPFLKESRLSVSVTSSSTRSNSTRSVSTDLSASSSSRESVIDDLPDR